jgi:hypothetical protein
MWIWHKKHSSTDSIQVLSKKHCWEERRAKYPNFKKKHHGVNTKFTKSAFKWKEGKVYVAKRKDLTTATKQDWKSKSVKAGAIEVMFYI